MSDGQTDAQVRRRYNKTVMDVYALRPLDKRARQADIAFAIALVALFLLVPLVVGPITFTAGKWALGLGVIAACWALALGLGLYRRSRVIRGFYRVDDPGDLVSVEPVDRSPLPMELLGVLLAFPFQNDGFELTFIYNWLLRLGALREDAADAVGPALEVYQLSGDALGDVYDASIVSDKGPVPAGPVLGTEPAARFERGADVLCIPLAPFALDDMAAARLFVEHKAAGALLLDTRGSAREA